MALAGLVADYTDSEPEEDPSDNVAANRNVIEVKRLANPKAVNWVKQLLN